LYVNVGYLIAAESCNWRYREDVSGRRSGVLGKIQELKLNWWCCCNCSCSCGRGCKRFSDSN